MKALSLTQPWAALVSAGAKRIETRSWSTSYTGPIAIHAAKGFPRSAAELCFERPFWAALGYRVPAELPVGAIVAVVHLTACLPMVRRADEPGHPIRLGQRVHIDDHPYTHWLTADELAFGEFEVGRFAWVLHDVRALTEPIPCRGALGLWTVPPDVEAAVRKQVHAWW